MAQKFLNFRKYFINSGGDYHLFSGGKWQEDIILDGEIDRLIKKLKSIQSGGHARVAAEYEREGTHKAPTT